MVGVNSGRIVFDWFLDNGYCFLLFRLVPGEEAYVIGICIRQLKGPPSLSVHLTASAHLFCPQKYTEKM